MAGAYGESGEGWFDGYGLVQALRKKAQSLGARYVAADVTAIHRDGKRVTQVQTANGETYACDVVVNAAGAWSRKVAQMVGIDIPVYARRRSIFNVTLAGAARTVSVADRSERRVFPSRRQIVYLRHVAVSG